MKKTRTDYQGVIFQTEHTNLSICKLFKFEIYRK